MNSKPVKVGITGSPAMESPELPEDVIHHILSFLNAKEATKTSILSKSWLRAWGTRPTLDFDPVIMGIFDRAASRGGRQGDHPKREDAAAFRYIISTLERYRDQKIGLEMLKLEIQGCSDSYPYVDRCVKLTAECGARKLDLTTSDYSWLPSVFEIKSLVELSLRRGRFKNRAAITCCNLKRLYLVSVDLYDDEMFANLIKSCPLIEILNIFNCRGVRKNLGLINLRNLKEVNTKLLAGQSVEVEATPNLELLTCRNVEEEPLMGRAKLPCSLNLRASQYKNLRSLLLYGMRMPDNFFGNFAYKFPSLQDLSIQNCQQLQRIEISSHSLKEIQVVNNNGLKEAQFDVPSIALFEFEGENETLPMLSLTAGSDRWASEIKLRCNWNVKTSWFLELKEFLMKLTQSEICLTIWFSDHVAFNVDEVTTIKAELVPEVGEIKELCLKGVQKFSVSSAHAILDGIFSICRPKTITHWHWLDYRFTKHLYQMLMIPRSDHSNNSEKMKFWQRHLRDVKEIEIFRNGISSLKRGRVDHLKVGRGWKLPKGLEWNKFIVVLLTRVGWTIVGFNLEWNDSKGNMAKPDNKRSLEWTMNDMEGTTCDNHLDAKRLRLVRNLAWGKTYLESFNPT